MPTAPPHDILSLFLAALYPPAYPSAQCCSLRAAVYSHRTIALPLLQPHNHPPLAAVATAAPRSTPARPANLSLILKAPRLVLAVSVHQYPHACSGSDCTRFAIRAASTILPRSCCACRTTPPDLSPSVRVAIYRLDVRGSAAPLFFFVGAGSGVSCVCAILLSRMPFFPC